MRAESTDAAGTQRVFVFDGTTDVMRMIEPARKTYTEMTKADLERMGDSAVNIVQAARQLNREPPLKAYVDLPRMSQEVQAMVRESLDAFVRRDAALAAQVCKNDDKVDDLYRQLFAELMEMMGADPKAVPRAVHLLLVARNLERIADHATNIAEDVIYLVEGEIVRHRTAVAEALAGPRRPPRRAAPSRTEG